MTREEALEFWRVHLETIEEEWNRKAPDGHIKDCYVMEKNWINEQVLKGLWEAYDRIQVLLPPEEK